MRPLWELEDLVERSRTLAKVQSALTAFEAGLQRESQVSPGGFFDERQDGKRVLDSRSDAWLADFEDDLMVRLFSFVVFAVILPFQTTSRLFRGD